MSQIVWSPIAEGVLTGKYRPGQPVPAGSRAASKVGTGLAQRLSSDQTLLERVQRLRPIAEGLDLTLAQLAVAWVLHNDNVAAALVGASRPEQIASNAKASGVELPAEALAKIDEVLGDSIIRDPELTAANAPSSRPC